MTDPNDRTGADEQAREVEVLLDAHDLLEGAGGGTECTCGWPDQRGDDVQEHPVLHIWRALEPVRAAERQEAARMGVRIAQAVLAGEDTVEWARNASPSSLNLGYAMELLDDLLDPDDERLADGVTGRSET